MFFVHIIDLSCIRAFLPFLLIESCTSGGYNLFVEHCILSAYNVQMYLAAISRHRSGVKMQGGVGSLHFQLLLHWKCIENPLKIRTFLLFHIFEWHPAYCVLLCLLSTPSVVHVRQSSAQISLISNTNDAFCCCFALSMNIHCVNCK